MISQNRDLQEEHRRRMMVQRDALSMVVDNIALGRKQGREEGLAEGRAEGKAEGKAEGRAIGLEEGKRLALEEATLSKQAAGRDAVLQVLAARGISVSAAVRARIAEETDLPRLQSWLVGAAVAERAEEILTR